MNIYFWTYALLAFFNVQYDYKVSKVPLSDKYIHISDGVLRTCIYPGDRSFKRGSPTFPRSELRLKEERVDGIYNASVQVLNVTAHSEMDYSVWQLFGNGALVMNRKRFGKFQVVVFDGTPKFTEVESLRKQVVDCNSEKNNRIQQGIDYIIKKVDK